MAGARVLGAAAGPGSGAKGRPPLRRRPGRRGIARVGLWIAAPWRGAAGWGFATPRRRGEGCMGMGT